MTDPVTSAVLLGVVVVAGLVMEITGGAMSLKLAVMVRLAESDGYDEVRIAGPAGGEAA